MKKIQTILILAATLIFSFSSCIDKNFDTPPSNCDSVKLTPTHSISQLKRLFTFSLTDNVYDTLKITEDIIISGYITSTDVYGNQYKEIVIQDDSAGIDILIDKTNLSQTYKLGTKIFVKCKGLYLGEQYKVIKLGGVYNNAGTIKFGRMSGADSILNKVLVRTCETKYVEPKTVKISEINDNLLYQLVRIDSVQFTVADTASTWADGINLVTVNHTLTDNHGKSIIVRTSGYASFAKNKLPKGSGYIIGILGKYNTDYQLYIRNLDDVKMENPRF